jgi:hypothetical protein
MEGRMMESVQDYNKQTNSVAFSPQANCTEWRTAAGRRILVPTFADRGLSLVKVVGPNGR